jgi:hypothetical protein
VQQRPVDPTKSLATNLLPNWVQMPPLRAKTHAAPMLSTIPPKMHDQALAGKLRRRDRRHVALVEQ